MFTKKNPDAVVEMPKNVFKKRSGGYSAMGEHISKQIQKALDEALTKKRLCKLLDISFPTLQDRFYADSWTAREKLILRQHGIIKGKWYDLDSDTNQGLAEGGGTLYPDKHIHVRLSRTKKGKGK